MLKKFSYSQKTVALIALFSILRLLYASSLDLGADESYYWVFALRPAWNYFDHPPMVAWLIRLTTLNLLLHQAVFVRSGAVIAAAAATWLIFRIGTLIKDQQAGWYAAVLYTASIYASTNAGTWIMPDGPLMVCWLTGILLLLLIIQAEAALLNTNRLWYLFGIVSGLAIMSKATGLFLLLGLVVFAFVSRRRWLKERGIYIGFSLCLIIISPIFIWNIQHDFATIRFHGGRISGSGSNVIFTYFLKGLLKQLSINNPVNIVLILVGIWYFIKNKLLTNNPGIQLILCCSLPLIFIVFAFSTFRETLPHWSSPGFCTLLMLPAVKLSLDIKNKGRLLPNALKIALFYLVFLSAATVLLINYFPGTASTEKEGIKMGLDDATLDSYGWKPIATRFDSLYKDNVAKKIVSVGTPIIVTNWFPASAIEYYITPLTGQPIVGIGDINDLHQYYWWTKNNRLKPGDQAYMIIPSHLFAYRTFNKVKAHFDSFDQPLTITQTRGGLACEFVFVFRFKGYHP